MRNKKSGWNDQCDEENTGLNYDPYIACSYLSENIMTNECKGSCTCTHTRNPNDPGRPGPHAPYCDKGGDKVNPKFYSCSQKDIGNTCEYGDLSGKLGQLEVQKDGDGKLFVQFKGVDKYFLEKSDFEVPDTDYSIVISKGGVRILCAKFMLLCKKS